MTLNRRRATLSAIIVAAVIGWAGAGTAAATDEPDSFSETHKWDLTSMTHKWD